MKRNILLDIDGVLADFYSGFAQYLNSNYGANLALHQEPKSYRFDEWETVSHIDMNEACLSWIKDGGFAKLNPYAGAKEFAKELCSLGNVDIVTARIGDFKLNFETDVSDRIRKDTVEWFQKFDIPLGNNLVFEHKKVDYCKAEGISIIVEDKLSTVLDAARNGIHSIIIDRAWNQHPERFMVYRAYSYPKIIDIVKRINND